jgi:hypothetical protein
MLPNDLIELLEKNDPEDINIVFTKIDHEKSNPTFEIRLSTQDDGSTIIRHWTIKTEQFRKSRISSDYASSIEIYHDHPILWQFSDIQSQVYFNGTCSDPDKLFVDLYKTHRLLFGDFISFDDTIHRSSDFNKILKYTNGLFATGPRKVISEYANLLGKYNLTYSIIGDRLPTYWDNEKHVTETGSAKVLFIDSSYIIADEFIVV